jgi:glycerol transport system ATP-binding protein
MARIDLDRLAHSYDSSGAQPTYALHPFTHAWEDGETYALLGPSGCGKTTLLNIMSGIVHPSEGRVRFDGLDVTELPTARRNIAQVFQFPVIYRTMTVFENLAFPLRCRRLPEREIRERVVEVADLLNLSGQLRRAALHLSADAKQLISLGRGLVRNDVAAILLDEPLTVIDPQLKFELRRKLKEVNRRYRLTLIYVTHDQTEAMTLANKVVVMNHGRVVQIGTPQELFERPEDAFVGYFIGSPSMNMLECRLTEGGVDAGGTHIAFPGIDRCAGGGCTAGRPRRPQIGRRFSHRHARYGRSAHQGKNSRGRTAPGRAHLRPIRRRPAPALRRRPPGRRCLANMRAISPTC